MSAYYMFVDQQYGPYDVVTLQKYHTEGILTKDSWVFIEGETTAWTRAEEVLSLNAIFFPPNTHKQTVRITLPKFTSQKTNSGVKIVKQEPSPEESKKISLPPAQEQHAAPTATTENKASTKFAAGKSLTWWMRIAAIFSRSSRK